MAEINESISSFQNHIMSKILMSDNIVRAVADSHPDFLSNRYEIANDIDEKYNIVDGNLRDYIVDEDKKLIHRFALKYDRVMPYLYDNDTITNQAVFIFFDISHDSTSRYVSRGSQNKLIIPYEIYINIYVHNNLVVTSYSKSRSVYIAEEIEALLRGNTIGRGNNTSFTDVEIRYNRPQALMNGRIHGRNMLFTTTGLVTC